MNEKPDAGNRDDLIAELSAQLEPTPKAGQIGPVAFAWGAFTLAFAAFCIALVEPFRHGAATQLVTHPRFAVESLLGLVTIGLLAVNAFRSGIPAPAGQRYLTTPALIAVAVWLSFYVVGLWWPAIEPSMSGKRHLCFVETFIYGLPMLAIGIIALRRQWPLRGRTSGLLLGLAAGLAPALLMQFACMYISSHILTHHILPGLAVGLVGLVAGHFFLRRP